LTGLARDNSCEAERRHSNEGDSHGYVAAHYNASP
jgi:hypothetical protein